MIFKRTILTILGLFLFQSMLFSQFQLAGNDSVFEKKLLHEVKQLDQFIGRFNLSENIYGNKYPQEYKDSAKVHLSSYLSARKKILKSLFDFENFKNDTVLIKGFINYVSENSRFISFNDNNWFAEVNTTVQLNGNEKNASIILQIEKNSKDEYKWVIKSVKADFLGFSSKKTEDFINPMSHETYFINLKKVFENTNQVKQYAYKGFKQDDLSIFFYLISQNKIQLKHINSISYQFLQIDNYIFTIDFLNRASFNSGWLISHLIEVNATQKEQYLRDMLNIFK